MKFIIGIMISFAVGVGCRYFDIPAGSPSVIPGDLLVLAMTTGYSRTNRILDARNKPANDHTSMRRAHWRISRAQESRTS